MLEPTTLLLTVVGLPLAAAVLIWLLGWLLGEWSHWLATVGIGLAFLASVALLIGVASRVPEPRYAAAHGEEHGSDTPSVPDQSVDEPPPPGEEPEQPAPGDEPTEDEPASDAEQPAEVEAAAPADQPIVRGQSPEEEAEGKGPAFYEQTVTLWSWLFLPQALTDSTFMTQAGKLDAEGNPIDNIAAFNIDITLRVDALTSLMLVVVTLVGLLVCIYSSSYMHGDAGFARYFAVVALFVFSMCMLVASSNFIMLYAFWEGVGVCSYLLIGHWFTRPEAASAAKKAFLVNRIGDIGLLLAIFLIWVSYGSLNFHDVELINGTVQAGVLGVGADTSTLRSQSGPLGPGIGVTTAIAMLLFVGAAGKSAQFPLHVWLPDAMEGPTPVSALIHAATMVTAGVYLLVRCLPIFAVSSAASYLVLVLGMFTALLAGLIALTQTDLKRVLAYSTVSQLGFMFMALGTGTFLGGIAAMFHLVTHAFFKALLFLGAGSVMHAMNGEINMHRFGGLWRLMPKTTILFAIGSLALAGFPFLSGFFSKDEILASVYEMAMAADPLQQTTLLTIFGVAVFTAFLTAVYTSRAFFLTFFGEYEIPPDAQETAHESSWLMLGPMAVLAVGAVLAGYFGEAIKDFLATTPSLAWAAYFQPSVPYALLSEAHTAAMGWGLLATFLGIGMVAFLYLQDRTELSYLGRIRQLQSFQQLSYRRFYIDEVYQVVLVWPARLIARLGAFLDRTLLDGIVDLVGAVPRWSSGLLRFLGAGLIQFYALAMIVGLLVLVWAGGLLQ